MRAYQQVQTCPLIHSSLCHLHTYIHSLLPVCRVCSAVVRGAPPELLLHLVEEPEFRYEDFAPRGEQSPPTMRAQVVGMLSATFLMFIFLLQCRLGFIHLCFNVAGLCVQDYSWEDHGFSLVNRLLPDMGQLLDEKFQVLSSHRSLRVEIYKY